MLGVWSTLRCSGIEVAPVAMSMSLVRNPTQGYLRVLKGSDK